LKRFVREYAFGVATILGLAKKLGVHRRMVRGSVGQCPSTRRKKPEPKRPGWRQWWAL